MTRSVFSDRVEQPGSRATFDVTVFSSNSWWRIITVPIDLAPLPAPKKGTPATLDFMRIPGGVRWYACLSAEYQGQTDLLPLAHALPLTSPPPENTEALIAWLAFCPNPELPLLPNDRIRRFVPSKWNDHPKNRGIFSLQHLEPAEAFVASLQITNEGSVFGATKAVIDYPPPFNRGWLESSYTVEEVTNAFGIILPRKAKLTRFQPKQGARAATETYPSVVHEIELMQLQPLKTEIAAPIQARLIVENTGSGKSPQRAHYMVTNDTWLSARDVRPNRSLKTAKPIDRAASDQDWIP